MTTSAVPFEITRELYDALIEARACVYNRLAFERAMLQPAKVETLTRILDRVDGALADAADYLTGGTA